MTRKPTSEPADDAPPQTPTVHPNIAAVERFDPSAPAKSISAMAEDVVWRYFNPHLPELHGEYRGRDGVLAFFSALQTLTAGGFRATPLDAFTVGDDLVVTRTRNHVPIGDGMTDVDVILVWRIVDGRISEVWDIPSLA